MANSEDPHEMPHNEAFHHGLHYLPSQKRSSEKEIQFYLGMKTCEPSIYTMDHSKFIVSNQKKESISTKCYLLVPALNFLHVRLE